ncbi:MAG: M15 family metallopeptidase [Candidatus Korobacteraceae bacterium]
MGFRAVLGMALLLASAAGHATAQQAASESRNFRITPLRPVEELRREALNASPPPQPGRLTAPDLVELTQLDPGIRLDIRYATANNFMGAPFYTVARAFLQRPAAMGVARAHRALTAKGYGLLIHDGYRPWHVTKMFWEGTPPEMRQFVADPEKGSLHNRGCAVDLTLYHLETGDTVEMPSGYDELSERAYSDYGGGTAEQRRLRDLLRSSMEAEGFAAFPLEWWHFNYAPCDYPVLNLQLEDLPATARNP